MEKAFITKDLDIFKKKPLSLLTSSQKRTFTKLLYYVFYHMFATRDFICI